MEELPDIQQLDIEAKDGSPPPRVIRFAYLNNWSEVEII